MTEPSAGTEAMRTIVDAAHPVLKAAGYRKRRHAFNRVVDDGLTHVVHFQRGQKPGWYDLFTVNVGVFVPEVAVVAYPDRKLPAFVNEFDCQFRQRIGFIIGDRDIWWDLSEEDPGTLGETIRNHIAGPVLAWLDERATSRSALLSYYERARPSWSQRTLAVIAAELGEHSRASVLIQGYLDRVAGMERPTTREVELHRGWIDLTARRYIDPFGLDVTYPVIELTG